MKITAENHPLHTGTIILLNGPTSTGKTSIAKAVQNQFLEPYLHLGVDTLFYEICPQPYFFRERAAEGLSAAPVMGSDPATAALCYGPFAQQLIAALHQMVFTLATLGHNVVVDHCIQEAGWLAECVALWGKLRVVFVSVHCPLAIVEQRVVARPDRGPVALPIARWQYHQIQMHGIYDLALDTTTLSPSECATAIQRYLAEGPPPTAFQQLATGERTQSIGLTQ